MIIKKAILLYFLICISFSCETKKEQNNSETTKIVKSFFETYKQHGPRNALEILLMTNKYIDKRDINAMIVKVENTVGTLDDYQGYEILNTRNYGESIKIVTCLVKYSQLPVQFTFKFYQPGNGWRIQNCNFQTNFTNDLDKDQ